MDTLVYDAENRTLSANNGTTSGTYTYDGNSRRVTRVTGGQTFVYIFSKSKVIAEYVNGVAPSAPTREYVYSGGTLLAKIESGATRYYHQDQLSNRLVTNSAGAVTEQLGHYPYGESWYSTLVDKLIFTSYDRDSESGNDYAMARSYISRFGRFSAVDPLSGSTNVPQSLNRYSYALNNPTNFTDPTGLFCQVHGISPGGLPTDYVLNGCSEDDCVKMGSYCTWTPDGNPIPDAGSTTVIVTAGGGDGGSPTGGCASFYQDGVYLGNVCGDPAPTGGGGGGGGVSFWRGAWSKTKQATLCAAKNAHELSPSGLFGVDGENHPFLNALGDNTFSGIVDATGHVASVFSGPDRPAAAAQVMADTVIGGVRQGIPGGGVLSKGLAGSALDFGVNAITKAAPIASLAGTGAELAGEGLAGPVGWAKIGVDAGIFAGAFVYCATR